MLLPRFVRHKDAPAYVGVDRNKFDADWRPWLIEIPLGPRTIAFDRLDLDELKAKRDGTWIDESAVKIPRWKDVRFAADMARRKRELAAPTVPELTAAQQAMKLVERARERLAQRRPVALFHANKRRAAKLQRTPPWADMKAIRAIYAEADRITAETGIPHHVDHEIPLQGKLVSGLHVHNNLQILTGSENSKKRNHYEVEV